MNKKYHQYFIKQIYTLLTIYINIYVYISLIETNENQKN